MTFYHLWLMACVLAWGVRILRAAGIALAALLILYLSWRVIING